MCVCRERARYDVCVVLKLRGWLILQFAWDLNPPTPSVSLSACLAFSPSIFLCHPLYLCIYLFPSSVSSFSCLLFLCLLSLSLLLSSISLAVSLFFLSPFSHSVSYFSLTLFFSLSLFFSLPPLLSQFISIKFSLLLFSQSLSSYFYLYFSLSFSLFSL